MVQPESGIVMPWYTKMQGLLNFSASELLYGLFSGSGLLDLLIEFNVETTDCNEVYTCYACGEDVSYVHVLDNIKFV